MPDFSIGVDLGGTNLRIAAVSSDGQLLEKVTLGTKTALGPDHVITEMCDAIQRLSGKYQKDGKFLGAGIGIPGIIDLHTGMLRKSANLRGFEEYPVRDEIERRLGIRKGARVVLENDANVAALGEQWLGAARGVPNMAVVTLGTGIGGGIVLGGKIWHGMNGMSGEFGHVTLEPEGYPCGCGNRGCAEQLCLRQRPSCAWLKKRSPPATRQSWQKPHHPILSSARSRSTTSRCSGDEPSRRIFHTFGRYLGIMLAGIVNVLNLDMYVLGGGVVSAWDAYAPKMFDELRARSLVYSATAPDNPLMTANGSSQKEKGREQSGAAARKTIITRAQLGSDAGLYGAAHVAAVSN